MTAALAEHEKLKAELKVARQEVKRHETATADGGKAQAAKMAARAKDLARVVEVEETLKGMFEACKKLRKAPACPLRAQDHDVG